MLRLQGGCRPRDGLGWGRVEKGRKRAGKGEILRCIGAKGRKRANKVSM